MSLKMPRHVEGTLSRDDGWAGQLIFDVGGGGGGGVNHRPPPRCPVITPTPPHDPGTYFRTVVRSYLPSSSFVRLSTSPVSTQDIP